MIKKRITHIFIAMFLTFSFPVSVLADTADGSSPTDSAPASAESAAAASETIAEPPAPAPVPLPAPPAAPSTGPSSPTGAGSTSYTYNPSTGLWENGYYAWNPSTHQTSPLTPQSYSYNPSTGMWDTTQWVYDAPSGKYVANVVSTPVNPSSTLSASDQAANGLNAASLSAPNTVNTSTNNSGIFNLFYNAQISNNLSQNAISGAAAVLGNTVAGNAISGNALDVMNVINMLKSSFGLQNAADLMTFTSNIDGNVVGDLYIDPSQISTEPLAVSNSNAQNNVAINANGSGLINNNITLGANSGNASVDSNTHAGSATTGNADAIANVVNMINSAIAANKSFLGVININGNLDGDILLPPNFLDQLLASNAPHTNVALSDSRTNSLTVNSNNNETINNDVSLTAASGSTNVANNTSAGNANSGSANTNLTIFNLTGRQIVAKDSILVFVNVLGRWLGLIMNAPSGTTAAAIGGNVTENNTVNNNAAINADINNTISNNINIGSQSGDAAVTNNTTAGDATSGNATASANIANIIDSQLSASDWFGLLFINVLGYWHGSFGVDTDAGTIFSQTTQTNDNNGPSGPSVAKITTFKFVPRSGSGGVFSLVRDQGSSEANAGTESHPVILASAKGGGSGSTPTRSAAATGSESKQNKWVLPVASFALVMIATSAIGTTGESTDKVYARVLSYRLKRSQLS
jgi:hypothetical protein